MDTLDFLSPGEDVFRMRHSAGGFQPPRERAHLLRASGRAGGGYVEIVLEHHAILRYTPCGAWVDTFAGEKFVNLRAGKQWASATETEAIDQLYYRKRKQVKILAARLAESETVQAAMEKHLGKKPPALRPWRPYSEYDYY